MTAKKLSRYCLVSWQPTCPSNQLSIVSCHERPGLQRLPSICIFVLEIPLATLRGGGVRRVRQLDCQSWRRQGVGEPHGEYQSCYIRPTFKLNHARATSVLAWVFVVVFCQALSQSMTRLFFSETVVDSSSRRCQHIAQWRATALAFKWGISNLR